MYTRYYELRVTLNELDSLAHVFMFDIFGHPYLSLALKRLGFYPNIRLVVHLPVVYCRVYKYLINFLAIFYLWSKMNFHCNSLVHLLIGVLMFYQISGNNVRGLVISNTGGEGVASDCGVSVCGEIRITNELSTGLEVGIWISILVNHSSNLADIWVISYTIFIYIL